MDSNVITVERICADDEYKPAPGTRYEIAEGVVVTLRRPLESIVDKYLEIDALPKTKDVKVLRQRKLEMVRIICDGVPADIQDPMYKVVDRVVTDFFTVHTPTVNAQTRSLLETLAVLSRNGDGASDQRAH